MKGFFLTHGLAVLLLLTLVSCGAEKPVPTVQNETQQIAVATDPKAPVMVWVVRLAPDGQGFLKQPLELPAGTTVEEQIKSLVIAMGEVVEDGKSLAVLPADSRCVAVYFLGEIAVLDMNAVFGNELGGGARETLDALDALAGMVQVNLPQVKGVRILLSGTDPGEINGVDLHRPILFRGTWAEETPA